MSRRRSWPYWLASAILLAAGAGVLQIRAEDVPKPESAAQEPAGEQSDGNEQGLFELPTLPEGNTSEAHLPLFEAWEKAPGRPAWAPLELTWGQTEFTGRLVEILHQGEAGERARAAFALALTGAETSRDALARSLTDPEPEVRQFAGLALCYLGDARGSSEALNALRQAPPWIRYYALVGLWRLDSAAARRGIRESRESQDPFLTTTIPESLHSSPWQPAVAAVSSVPATSPSPTSAAEIWGALADSLELESDYWWHFGDYDQVCRALEEPSSSARCGRSSIPTSPTCNGVWGGMSAP
jgi:hypothetical protein